jgi:hypothetical protein
LEASKGEKNTMLMRERTAFGLRLRALVWRNILNRRKAMGAA